ELFLGPLHGLLALGRRAPRRSGAETVGVVLGLLVLGLVRLGRRRRGRGRRGSGVRLVAIVVTAALVLVATSGLVVVTSLAVVVPAAVAIVVAPTVAIVVPPPVAIVVAPAVVALAVLIAFGVTIGVALPLLALPAFVVEPLLALPLDLDARLACCRERLEQLFALFLGCRDLGLGVALQVLGGGESIACGLGSGLVRREGRGGPLAQSRRDDGRHAEALHHLVGPCAEHAQRLGGLDEVLDAARLEHGAQLVARRARAHGLERDAHEASARDVEVRLGLLELLGRGTCVGRGRVARDERLGVVLGGALHGDPRIVELDTELGEPYLHGRD